MLLHSCRILHGLNNYIVLHACLQCTVTKRLEINIVGCSINETSQCLETTEKLYPMRLEKHFVFVFVCIKLDNEQGK